jgi:type I restriction enzyme, S subunit
MNQDLASIIINSQLKEGYKQTEVGIIPEDWDVATAIQICEIIIDCKNRTPPVIEGGEFAVVRTPNVRNGRFVYDDLRFTDESSFHEWTARAIPQIGDILITREAPLGEVCLVPKELKVCLGQRMMLYRPDRSKIDSAFFLYSLMAPIVQKCLLKKIGGSTVGHAKVDDIRNVSIPLPPTKAEQEAIACTLGDIDALIESLDRLLTKKRQIKQGAMQELLTGKQRLPGFSGKWRTELLTNLVQSHNAGVYKARELYGEGCKIIGVSDIYGINALADQEFGRVPLTKEEIKQYSLEENDLVYGESSLVKEGIARTVHVTKQGAGNAFAWHTRRFKVSQNIISSKYLYYYLQSQDARKHMMENSIQTAITGINTTAYFACPIAIPSLDEQIEIANILSDMDAEIGSIESKLAKTRQLKQGMMHELLTGRIRLVDPIQ